jgi:hypothetical protein
MCEMREIRMSSQPPPSSRGAAPLHGVSRVRPHPSSLAVKNAGAMLGSQRAPLPSRSWEVESMTMHSAPLSSAAFMASM